MSRNSAPVSPFGPAAGGGTAAAAGSASSTRFTSSACNVGIWPARACFTAPSTIWTNSLLSAMLKRTILRRKFAREEHRVAASFYLLIIRHLGVYFRVRQDVFDCVTRLPRNFIRNRPGPIG